MWWQVRYGTGRPAPFTCVKKTEDNPAENKRIVIFLILLAFFFWYKWMVSLKTIIKKKKRLTRDWTKPRCKHTSSKAKGHLKLSELSHVVSPSANRVTSRQSVVKSSVNCFLFVFFCVFLLQLVSHVCKVSAPVPEMNRNLVLSKLPAENQSTCQSHTFSRSNYFILSSFLLFSP